MFSGVAADAGAMISSGLTTFGSGGAHPIGAGIAKLGGNDGVGIGSGIQAGLTAIAGAMSFGMGAIAVGMGAIAVGNVVASQGAGAGHGSKSG